jgi:hypothetical protein
VRCWREPSRAAEQQPYTGHTRVWIPDGSTDVFTANIIAENLYWQVNGDGHSYILMSEIIDHKSDGTVVSKDDGYETT